MTKPDEVTVTDAEVAAFDVAYATARNAGASWQEATRCALAAFLAARVPDAKNTDQFEDTEDHSSLQWWSGHNACRDAVLKGPQK